MEQIRLCLRLLDPSGRREMTMLGVMIFFNSILEMLSVSLIIPFIVLINDAGLIKRSALLHSLYSVLSFSSTTAFLAAIGFTLFALVLFKNLYLYFVTRRQSRFCHRQAARVAEHILSVYLHGPYQMHLIRNSANLINTTDHAADQSFAQVMMPFLIATTEASSVAAILLLLLVVEPIPTLVLIAIVGVCSVALVWFLRERLGALGANVFRLRTARLQRLQQALYSVKEIKVLGREGYFVDAFGRARREHAEVQARVDTLVQLPRQVIEVIVVGGLMLVIVFVLLRGETSTELMKVLGLFAMAAFRIMPGANRLVTSINTIKHANANLLETANDYFSGNPANDRPALSSQKPFAQNTDLVMENVTFAYDGSSVPVLEDVSLQLARGQSVGLVGPSGAGKSTLVDVLLGLLRPQSGRVLLGGRDIMEDRNSGRGLIGYVPQAISLIDDTLRNNVAFGLPPDEIDDDAVWRALARANLDEFCRSIPSGLDTMLGERGVRLSGGQRQRVGIARALFLDPPVLIFDEATSALDNENEREVTAAIEALYGDKAMLIIAHRLSTIRRCGKIVMMKNGRILGTGTFEQLVESCDEFQRAVRLGELMGQSALVQGAP